MSDEPVGEDETLKKFRELAFPVDPNLEAGMAFFNMFTMWVAGGFTEDQALTLLAKWMVENVRRSGDGQADG